MMGRKKILHVITSLEAAGAQTLLVDLLSRLDPTRFDSTVAFLKGRPGVDTALLPRVIDLSRGGAFDPLSPFRLARRLRAEQIDLVHTHLVHAGVIGKVAARLAGTRRVVTTRHYARELKSRALAYRLEDHLTGACDRVIAVSDAVRAYLVERRIAPAERIVVIPNAIDLERFDPSRYTPRQQGSRVVGTVGRLHAQKGHDTLLRAFARVHARDPAVRLEIVGEGPLRALLVNLVHRLELDGAVSFRGVVKPAEIPAVLAGWDLFLFPSRWEAFGIALAEAMAMELPVIVSGVEGIVELVEPGATGLLVPPDDPEALASALLDLLSDPKRARGLGVQARARIRERFDAAVVASRLADLYDELVP